MKKRFIVFIVLFFCLFIKDVNCDFNIPKTIKIGLSFGSKAANNFTFKSENTIIFKDQNHNNLFSEKFLNGVLIRKDTYYNYSQNKLVQINYEEGKSYSGELYGPYHIQIGQRFNSLDEALSVMNSISGLTSQACIYIDNGYYIWCGMYLNELECNDQIALFKNENNNYEFKVIYPDKKRLLLLDGATEELLYILSSDSDIIVTAIQTENTPLIEYNNRKYRGQIILKRLDESDITVINEVDFEQYLYGVVPSECYASWNIEALKAQAVAARNYAILNMNKYSKYGFNLSDGQGCQVYKGYSIENPKTNEAVDLTKGKLILYNGELVNTFYHSSSGGKTESVENIWGSKIPYLVGVEDSYSLGSQYDNWTKVFDKETIKEKMLSASLDVGDIVDIIPKIISENGRVIELEVRGTKDTKTLLKEKIRNVLGTIDLKSIWYEISTDADIYIKNKDKQIKQRAIDKYIKTANVLYKNTYDNTIITVKGSNDTTQYYTVPNNYTFCGHGFGHGVGMSQYGAQGMANAGYNYIQILEHYYSGAKVQ